MASEIWKTVKNVFSGAASDVSTLAEPAVTSISDRASNAYNAAATAVSETVEGASILAGKAKDKVAEVVDDNVVTPTKNAYNAATTTVSETAQGATIMAADATNAAVDVTVNNVVNPVKGAYNATATAVSETAQGATIMAADATNAVVDATVDNVVNPVKGAYNATATAVNETVQGSRIIVADTGRAISEAVDENVVTPTKNAYNATATAVSETAQGATIMAADAVNTVEDARQFAVKALSETDTIKGIATSKTVDALAEAPAAIAADTKALANSATAAYNAAADKANDAYVAVTTPINETIDGASILIAESKAKHATTPASPSIATDAIAAAPASMEPPAENQLAQASQPLSLSPGKKPSDIPTEEKTEAPAAKQPPQPEAAAAPEEPVISVSKPAVAAAKPFQPEVAPEEPAIKPNKPAIAADNAPKPSQSELAPEDFAASMNKLAGANQDPVAKASQPKNPARQAAGEKLAEAFKEIEKDPGSAKSHEAFRKEAWNYAKTYIDKNKDGKFSASERAAFKQDFNELTGGKFAEGKQMWEQMHKDDRSAIATALKSNDPEEMRKALTERGSLLDKNHDGKTTAREVMGDALVKDHLKGLKGDDRKEFLAAIKEAVAPLKGQDIQLAKANHEAKTPSAAGAKDQEKTTQRSA